MSSDFLVKEFKEKEGLWVGVDDYLIFVDSNETHYHCPKDLHITTYEVRNFSKEFEYYGRKQFSSFKSVVKDVSKKLANKKEGYEYGIYIRYTWDSGKNGMGYVASVRKGSEELEVSIPHLRKHFANGTLEEDELNIIKNRSLPDSWLATRRVNRPILLLENELKEVHHVKDILYTASHPHQEKERFLRTLERYFSSLSKVIEPKTFSPLTISHGENKTFSGNYSDWSKEMVLQPKHYTSFFHLYWFHMYYDLLYYKDSGKAVDLFEELIKKINEEETMINHFKQYERILNKKGEVLSKYKHKSSGRYHHRFVSPHQMAARLFSDYFFYHYDTSFEHHEKKKKYNFSVREIDLFSPILEKLINEIQKEKKKKS